MVAGSEEDTRATVASRKRAATTEVICMVWLKRETSVTCSEAGAKDKRNMIFFIKLGKSHTISYALLSTTPHLGREETCDRSDLSEVKDATFVSRVVCVEVTFFFLGN